MSVTTNLDIGEISANQDGASDYDILPYRSVAYPQSQPSHTSAVAQMFGLEPAAVESARVLELGCASGGNIVPLAARFPKAMFHGIDLSARQIADGKRRVEALELDNVKLEQGDIGTFNCDANTFDYVITHGVYSWVPPEVQDAIFRIASQGLSENGILYVSYNTYPGWHMRNIVRDICLYHAGDDAQPELRVARARWALDKIANNASDSTPFGTLMRNEAKLNATLPDSYILGEFLATHNAPCYFHEFLAKADANGMAYFSETELASSVPESLGEETGKTIRAIAGDSGLALEQYLDFFAGRQFRRSLMIRKDQASRVKRSLNPESLENLRFSSAWRNKSDSQPEGSVTFTNGNQEFAASNKPLIKLLTCLEQVYPENRSLDEITQHMVEGTGATAQQREQARSAVGNLVFQLVTQARLEISTVPLLSGRADVEKPFVFPLARYDATLKQGWVSCLRHKPVGMDVNLSALIQHLDGKLTREDFHPIVSEYIKDGRIRIKGVDLNSDTSDELMQRITVAVVDQFLKQLERDGLLLALP